MMRGSCGLKRVLLALAIHAALTVAARPAPEALAPDPGYQLPPRELAAVAQAVADELGDPGPARFVGLIARPAPAPSRSVNVCGFVAGGDAPGAGARGRPFMAALLRSPKTGTEGEDIRAVVVGIGDPSNISRSYTICKLCAESALELCE